MSELGSSEKGKWHNEADKNQNVISVSTLSELESIRHEKEGIIVLNGDTLRLSSPASIVDFIRKEYSTSMPIVYLAADSFSTKAQVEFFDAGGDALLSGSDRTLLPGILTAIQRRLRLVSHLTEIIEPIEKFVVDPFRRTLSIRDEKISLTAQEFYFVSLVASEHPKLITYKQFFDEVLFGRDNRNLVRVVISHINRKIAPFKIEYVTHKNGYALVHKLDI